MQLFQTPINHPVLIALIVVYAIAAAITTYDIRYMQAKKENRLPQEHLEPPYWIGFFAYLLWGTWAAILLLSGLFALVLIIVKFIFKVIPVLEVIGEELMRPFSRQTKTSVGRSSHKGGHSDSYAQVVEVLDQIEETKSDPPGGKKDLSLKLIENAPINSAEKESLKHRVKQRYSGRNE